MLGDFRKKQAQWAQNRHKIQGGDMKIIALGFTVCIFAVAAFVTWSVWPPKDALVLGNFLVIVLTLIVLVFYAYDTNSIARVTRDRWMREGVLSAIYSMDLVEKKGQAGKTLFRIHNPSPLIVRASVVCNFRVYGDPVTAGPAFDGEENWIVFPQQMSQQPFIIDSLLQQKGKNVSGMIAECTPTNCLNQLTMLLELEFWDELGARRKLPGRRHYFDFDRWVWIPYITETRKS